MRVVADYTQSIFSAKVSSNLIRRLLKTGSAQALGMAMKDDGIALALSAKQAIGAKPAKLDFLEGENLSYGLKAWVEANRCARADCHLVLQPGDYQLLLVEAPEVPPEEMREALRWRIRDLLTMSPDQAVIDYFFPPEDGTKSRKKMCYVVAAEKQRLQALVDWLTLARLEVKSIDIGELALAQINRVVAVNDGVADSNRARILVSVTKGAGEILIFRHHLLYFARSFELTYAGGAEDPLPTEQLVLEIQRSIDYFERHMGQTPPMSIDLCGDHLDQSKLTEEIKQAFSINLRVLDQHTIWPNATVDEETINPSYAAAIGVLLKANRGGL